MYRVFTTSTGEATTVAQKPAPKAETKWQGKLSVEGEGRTESRAEACVHVVQMWSLCLQCNFDLLEYSAQV